MVHGHPDDRQLLDLAMGRPAPDEADAVRRHCSQCSRCRKRVEQLRAVAERVCEADHALVPSAELWRCIAEQAEPLLEDFRQVRRPSAGGRAAPARRLAWRRTWAVAASILLLVGAAGGGLALWSNLSSMAAAGIVEAVGPVRITRPGQPPRKCRPKGELVRVGDILSAPEADAAIRLEDATSLALRRGCRLEVYAPDKKRHPTFALREGTVWIDTTRAKRGVCIKTPSGTVRCRKGKTVVQVTSPRCCKATALQGEVEVESGSHVAVIASGVCAELKRSKPCCRPAQPQERRCDWVERCGKSGEPKAIEP